MDFAVSGDRRHGCVTTRRATGRAFSAREGRRRGAARNRRALAVRPSPRALTRSARPRRRRALLRAPRRADGLEGRCEPAVVRPSRLHGDLPARHRLPRTRGSVPRRALVRGSAIGSGAVPERPHELLRDRPPLGDAAERRDGPPPVLGGPARVRRPHRDRRRVLLGVGPVGGELRQHCSHRRRRRMLRLALAVAVSRRARRPASAPLRARRRGDRSLRSRRGISWSRSFRCSSRCGGSRDPEIACGSRPRLC